jgi:hypothetical protein
VIFIDASDAFRSHGVQHTKSMSLLEDRSLITLWSAVVGGSFANPYNGVMEVTAADRRSVTFIIHREVSVWEPADIALGIPQSGDGSLVNAAGAPICAVAVSTPITVAGTIAKFHTVFPHNVYSGRGVSVLDPNPTKGGLFQGWKPVKMIADKRSFTWELPSAPGQNGPPGYSFAQLWQTDRLLIENNVIDLGIHFHPDFEETLYGISESVGIAITGVGSAQQYTWRSNVIRENIINATLPPGIDEAPKAAAITQAGTGSAVIESNLLGMPIPDELFSGGDTLPVPLEDSRVGPMNYFGNQTFEGEVFPAYHDARTELRLEPFDPIGDPPHYQGVNPQFLSRTRRETLLDRFDEALLMTF